MIGVVDFVFGWLALFGGVYCVWWVGLIVFGGVVCVLKVSSVWGVDCVWWCELCLVGL